MADGVVAELRSLASSGGEESCLPVESILLTNGLHFISAAYADCWLMIKCS